MIFFKSQKKNDNTIIVSLLHMMTFKVKCSVEYSQCLLCNFYNFVDISSTINLPPGIISIELKLSVLAVAAGAFQLTNDDRTDQSLP